MEEYCVLPLLLFFSPLMGHHPVAVAQCYAPLCGQQECKRTVVFCAVFLGCKAHQLAATPPPASVRLKTVLLPHHS